MKSFSKNMFGFAHHALLGVVVVAVIALAGVRVLTATHAASGTTGVLGYFQTNDNQAWPNSQHYATLDVAVPYARHAKKVVWYRDKVSDATRIATTFTHTKATVNNGYMEHFKYIWKISYASANLYRWVAVIYPSSGNQLPAVATDEHGKTINYLDTLVTGNGGFWDSKFIHPANNAVWKACDQSNFLRVEIRAQDVDVQNIKAVQFINKSDTDAIQYTVTSPAYVHDGPSFHKYVGYDYYPVGAGCLKKGPYHWIARVIGTNGGVNLALDHSNAGVYYLDLTAK